MGQAISISELSIKVRLDSKSAQAGLKRLETKLKTFQHYVKNSLKLERVKVIAMHQQINAKTKLIGLQKKSNNESRKQLRLLKRAANSARFMKNAMIGGWIGGMISKFNSGIRKITEEGMAVNMSRMSLGAAVAASGPAKGKSTAEVNAMTARQKAFAMETAGKYGQNVAGGTAQYAKFFAASSNNIGVEGSMQMYESLSKLGVVYGLTGEKMERAMTAFTQMASKNQVMAEELKQQLGDVLPGAMEIFADAMTEMGTYGTVTVKRLYELMEKGEIVASEVFPAVAKRMSDMAEANGALGKALKETSVRWQILKTNFSFFSTTALNQYNDTLGELIVKVTKLMGGIGFATAIGQFIDSYLGSFTKRFDDFFVTMAEFEKKFADATSDEERNKLIDDLFSADGGLVTDFLNIIKNLLTDIFKFFVDGFVAAINMISKDNLKALGDTLASVFQYAWDAFYNNLGDGMFKDVVDFVKGPEVAERAMAGGGKLVRYADMNSKSTSMDASDYEKALAQGKANLEVVNNITVNKDDVQVETLVGGKVVPSEGDVHMAAGLMNGRR